MTSLRPLALSAVLWIFMWPVGIEAGEITMVHLGDSPWPPYTLGEVGQPATGGIGVELVREVYKRLGIETRIELYPWKRVLKMAELGRIDGATLVMKTGGREKYLAYTNSLFEARELLCFRKDRLGEFNWKTYSDLRGYTIGLVNGYTYGEAFLKAIDEQGLKVEYAVSDEVNFQKLYAGRIDLFLEDEMVAKALLQKQKDWRGIFGFASKPVTVYHYHLAISKKSPVVKLIPKLNKVISDMKSEGAIEGLLRRYE